MRNSSWEKSFFFSYIQGGRAWWKADRMCILVAQSFLGPGREEGEGLISSTASKFPDFKGGSGWPNVPRAKVWEGLREARQMLALDSLGSEPVWAYGKTRFMWALGHERPWESLQIRLNHKGYIQSDWTWQRQWELAIYLQIFIPQYWYQGQYLSTWAAK